MNRLTLPGISLRLGIIALVLAAAPWGWGQDAARQRQEQYLKDSLLINYKGNGRYPMTTLWDKTWEDWQKRTGELPPDFSRMPSQPLLPDPLTLELDGRQTTITTPEQWQAKKSQVREQFQHWISGTPPPPPGNVEATILEDKTDPEGARLQRIRLRFGPDHKGVMNFDLILPPGKGPFPVYMTQWTHRDWSQLAVRRGYIGCVYAGADGKDDTEDYQALYPDYDFTQLMRRAWGASRVIDYLETRPEVNQDQIAITGHSRNGKQSLWATAFDDRIDAVISSSCGTGGIMPWRFSDPQYCNETLDSICRIANVWFQPRLRFFFGRENKLPVDQNLLLASIAPRPLLMHYSHMEAQSNAWAAEQCYHSAKKAYDFLGAGDNISMLPRGGFHAVAARDVERCIDFLDVKFKRRNIPWETRLFFTEDFDRWKTLHPEAAALAATTTPLSLTGKESLENLSALKPDITGRLQWLLGDKPAGIKSSTIAPTVPSRYDWTDRIIERPIVNHAASLYIGPYTAMGDHLAGIIHYPLTDEGTTRTRGNGKIPVVIYLHPFAYAHGYAIGNAISGQHNGTRLLFQQLIDNGFAVMAIDMFGFGSRLEEARNFYDRQPGWSKMGKMVSDVSACVDALETIDFMDHDQIFILGDTIGGTVGLLATAMDERIAGVAAVAAISPWRTSNAEYESIRVLSSQHVLMPRLGLFAEKPASAPVDFTEILALIAPRKLLLINPELNWHSDPAATWNSMDIVKHIYKTAGHSADISVQTPREINRITPEMRKDIIGFLSGNQNR